MRDREDRTVLDEEEPQRHRTRSDRRRDPERAQQEPQDLLVGQHRLARRMPNIAGRMVWGASGRMLIFQARADAAAPKGRERSPAW